MARPTASPSPSPRRGPVRDEVVEPAGLVPEAELPGLNPAAHVLAGAAGQGQLEIMDQRGAVGGNQRHDAALHEIDDEACQAELDQVAADEQDHRAPLPPRGGDALDEFGQFRMVVWHRGRGERQAILPAQQVAALGQVAQLQMGAIEQGIACHGGWRTSDNRVQGSARRWGTAQTTLFSMSTS
jgi:hypothetical protein